MRPIGPHPVTHILAHERERERRVHGVAERIEDRAELRRHVGVMHPDVHGGQRQELGEGAVALQSEADRTDAHLAASCAAIAARAAHDVPLARHSIAHSDVVDERTDLDDLAVELVTGDEWGIDGGCSPVVPATDMQVGAADPRAQHADHDFVGRRSGLGTIHELESGGAFGFEQCLHMSI